MPRRIDVVQPHFQIVQTRDGFEITSRLSGDEPIFDDVTPLVLGGHIQIDPRVVHVIEHRLGDGN